MNVVAPNGLAEVFGLSSFGPASFGLGIVTGNSGPGNCASSFLSRRSVLLSLCWAFNPL